MRWTRNIANKPIEESLVFIFSLGFFLYFLYFISPLYEAHYVSSLALAIGQRSQEYIFGTFFLATTLPGLVAPFVKNKKWLYRGSTLMFIDTAFLAIVRVLAFGLLPATWLPLVLISMACLIITIYVRANRE